MKTTNETANNNSMGRKPVNMRIATKLTPRRLSIGNHVLAGAPASTTVGPEMKVVGTKQFTTPKQRQDVQPTWRGEFEDDFIHPAARPSTVPITAGGIAGPQSGQSSNSFRTLGDAFGARA